MYIVGNSIDELFFHINRVLIRQPEYCTEVRGYKTHELIAAKVVLKNPYRRIVTLKGRHIDMPYLIGELCLFLHGSNKLSDYVYYSKFWSKVSDDGETINSAYGKRLFYAREAIVNSEKVLYHPTQFRYTIEKLKEDKYSRKAVMVIYDVSDAFESKDNPCTLALQFLIRNDKLHCITTMRSNDLYFGFTYDIAFFTFVQEMVLVSLLNEYPTLQMGTYTHNAGSLHLYERNFDKANKIDHELKLSFGFELDLMPKLVSKDLDCWFDDLLMMEKIYRMHPQYTDRCDFNDVTHFQNYAIKILEEKKNGVISRTNITE